MNTTLSFILTFLKHLAIALLIGMLGVPILMFLLLLTNVEFGIVDSQPNFLIVLSLLLLTAVPCVCFYLIRKKRVSKWVLLTGITSSIAIVYIDILCAIAYID